MEKSDRIALEQSRREKKAYSPTIAPTYTLADKMLAGHERTFTVRFLGKLVPLWKLVEHLAYITDKNDQTVRFRYNYQQCIRYLEKCKLKEAGKDVRTNTLKARQGGITTQEAVEMTIEGLFTPNMNCAIVADLQEHAAGIFEKVQFVYDHLDWNNPNRALIEEDPKKYISLSYKPTLRYNKGQKMLCTKDGNSRIEVVCVSDSAGRSRHYTRIHCSEVAFWDGMEKALLSLFKTVSRGNPRSQISLETTANGFNDYKIRWDKDFAGGDGTFKAIFLPWYIVKEYRQEIPVGYDLMANLDQWEIEKMEKHKLSPEQMYWFHLEYIDAGKKKDFVLQEDPFDPIDAFISTGSSTFDKDLIDMRKREIVEEMMNHEYECGYFTCKHLSNADQTVYEVPPDSIKWNKTSGGAIKIFEAPKPGHPYVVTCDPFMGGSDNVAMQVLDNNTGEQVARFVSNELSNDRCAWQLYCLGRMYNWALISCETNVGQIVMDLIVKAKYPKIYITQAKTYENYKQSLKTQFGHKTTKANRQFMLDSLSTAFEENPGMIRDYDTICEMETFQNVEHVDRNGNVVSVKQEAAGGAHDDLVMALAAFFLVRNQQTALIQENKVTTERKMTFEEIEAAYYAKQEERAKQGDNDYLNIGGNGNYGGCF